ncbi:type III-A CRISPR-associated protein Csm2, partial [Allocoleopsis sp.]|uniref:type III-A CRISPR-associated protein Csm2 n=1 Tax=Allocoleopsis sp. TaxID=3088169 RepID=UPI002FCF9643
PNISRPTLSNQSKQLGEVQNRQKQANTDSTQQKYDDIVTRMVKKIDAFKTGLKEYKIRELVEDTEELGKILADKGDKGLKTTQIRKFLDAVNRFKVQKIIKNKLSEESRDELHILRYQLAYATARQQKGKDLDSSPVAPLKKVLEAAIKQIKNEDLEDFKRFVQLIEAIVAYHKAAGGKDQ